MLDGLEITQFTYFQQCGGIDLDPISVELTYGLDRIAAYLQGVDNVYDVRWSDTMTYGQVRLAEEQQFSAYSFDLCRCGFHAQAVRSGGSGSGATAGGVSTTKGPRQASAFRCCRSMILCLKCSHLFNLLDARGAISVTERAGDDRRACANWRRRWRALGSNSRVRHQDSGRGGWA